MRPNRSGVAPRLLGSLPTLPSNPARARVAHPEWIADKRKLIKDDTDEALSEIEIVEHQSPEQGRRGCDRFSHPIASTGLSPPAPRAEAGTLRAAKFRPARWIRWRHQHGEFGSAQPRRVFQ